MLVERIDKSDEAFGLIAIFLAELNTSGTGLYFMILNIDLSLLTLRVI
jgi:hypothetical protein